MIICPAVNNDYHLSKGLRWYRYSQRFWHSPEPYRHVHPQRRDRVISIPRAFDGRPSSFRHGIFKLKKLDGIMVSGFFSRVCRRTHLDSYFAPVEYTLVV